jgi:DNA-binding response OmpR family regulator
MNEAKVGVFDSSNSVTEVYRKYLARKGHRVVVAASSFDEAWASLVNSGQMLDVAIVDLDPGAHRSTEARETENVIALLREKFEDTVKIVTVLSSGELPEGANVHFEKMDIRGIAGYIGNL